MRNLIILALACLALLLAVLILPRVDSDMKKAQQERDWQELYVQALRGLHIGQHLDSITRYYDGNGKRIPRDIVQLEVKSHFVKMTQAEKDSINKYFYLDTLK